MFDIAGRLQAIWVRYSTQIYIQNEKPSDSNQLKNWLPAPKENFHFAFRFYGLKEKLIDWTYDMRGVVRVK
jgi:hypothetical protein